MGNRSGYTATKTVGVDGLGMLNAFDFTDGRVLNNDLAGDFRRWYPGFTHHHDTDPDDYLWTRNSHGLPPLSRTL